MIYFVFYITFLKIISNSLGLLVKDDEEIPCVTVWLLISLAGEDGIAMRRSFGHEDLHLLQDLCDLPQCLQVFRIDSELIHNRVYYRFQLSTL